VEEDHQQVLYFLEDVWAAADSESLLPNAGVLTKTALALMALQRLAKPPISAIVHALSVIADDTAVVAAWAAFPGSFFLNQFYIICYYLVLFSFIMTTLNN
jgi:hypothetical protein